GAPLRPLEQHMLQQVGDPRLLVGLVPSTGVDADAQSDALDVRYALRDDSEAVVQGGFSNGRVQHCDCCSRKGVPMTWDPGQLKTGAASLLAAPVHQSGPCGAEPMDG